MSFFRLLPGIIILLFNLNLYSQSTGIGVAPGTQSVFPEHIANLLPPSPDASAITKYGSLPIGLFTGTAQFNLPIYTIDAGSLKHAISIGYSSNGVKVDEMATRVGLNWNLTAGGIITRTTMDLPDGSPGVSPTFFHGPITWDTSSSSSWDVYNYVRQASYSIKPDFQPDEYSFNVDGYTGKFLRRENGDYAQFNSSAMKIEKNANGFILTAPTGVKYYFYLFEAARNFSEPVNDNYEWAPAETPSAWYLTKVISPGKDSLIFNYLPVVSNGSHLTYFNGVSQSFNSGTWNGKVILTGDYGGLDYFCTPIGGFLSCIDVCDNIPNSQPYVQKSENFPYYLSSILFKGGKVDFIYSTNRLDVPGEVRLDTIRVTRLTDNFVIKQVGLGYSYSYASPGSFDTYIIPLENYTSINSHLRRRLFLTSFEEIPRIGSARLKHIFEYDNFNALPPRLSFSQDRYGGFNGKINTYFFPNDTYFDFHIGLNQFGGDRSYSFNYAKLGLLKKVHYPTGGYTEFEYEPNKTEYDYSFLLKKDSAYVHFDTSSYIGQTIISDTVYYNNSLHIGMSLNVSCEWASNPIPFTYNGADTVLEGTYRVDFSIKRIENDSIVFASFIEPTLLSSFGTFGIPLPAGHYLITAIANRAHLRAKITLVPFWKESDKSALSGIAGVRIKSLSDFTSNNLEASRREFIYSNWGDSLTNTGTGVFADILNSANVTFSRQVGPEIIGCNSCPGSPGPICGYNSIQSNSVIQTFHSDRNTVVYKKVCELLSSSKGSNSGGTEYEFFYDARKYPIPISFVKPRFVWEPLPFVPDGAPDMNNDFRTGMVKTVKQFTYGTKHGTRVILNETKNYYSVDTTKLVIDTFLVSKMAVKREGGVPSWIYNLDYNIFKYWRYFGFLKLDSVVEKSYKSGPIDSLVNKTKYASYNSVNYLPNNIQNFRSNGDTLVYLRKYIADVTSGEEDFSIYNSMRNLNMVNSILKEETYRSPVISSPNELTRKRLKYSNAAGLYLPAVSLSSLKGGTEYVEATYQVYNKNGKLIQYQGKDGVVNTILWGYDSTYPVAKVSGIGYSSLLAQSGVSLAILNNPSSDFAMRTELNKIRLVNGVFATTYTYSPLLGVTSITDERGKGITYEYDAFNRLSLIRDQDNNIVKQICYNYSGQVVDCGYGTIAAWENLSDSCQVSGGVFTGNMVLIQKDMNPSSTTYNQTRTIIIQNQSGCISCSGLDKKMINGVCETGTKVCDGNFRPPGQGWQHYYHYVWSDQSVSPTYTGTGLCLTL